MTDEPGRHVLVVANETAASRALVDRIRAMAEEEPVRVTVVAPVTQPRHGYVVYYDTRRAAARRRLDRTLGLLRGEGVPATGIVVETDPVSAIRDGINLLEPDEILVSTHPQPKSGWLRRNLVDQMRACAGDIPFEHVVVDLAAEHGEQNVLVVANRTVLGDALLAKIRERASRGPVSFLIIAPQGDGDPSHDEAERRLLRAVTILRSDGLDVHGQISHPDPYSAVMAALEEERVNEIILSTLPSARSGWLRRDLLERLRSDTKLPIEHVESDVAERVAG